MSYKQACANGGSADIGEDEEEEGWPLNEGWKEKIWVERIAKGFNIIMLPEYRNIMARKWRFAVIVTILG